MKIAAFILVSFIGLVFFLRAWSPEGIVTVPGYEHGVALCESKDPYAHEEMVLRGKAHIWMEGGVLYIVNEGHLGDPEVDELKKWGSTECAQYQTKE